MQFEGIQMEIKVLHQHGWSISALAREFGLSWNTVKRVISSPGPRHYPQRAKPTALTDAQRAHVERRLAMCPSLRGTTPHLIFNPSISRAHRFVHLSVHLLCEQVLQPCLAAALGAGRSALSSI